ncbi:MAG TPA: DUF4403 family protein [Bacteroidales bacterium]|nr:DUF4403 family protein [Bacteroidales bacterium]HSA42111.1 DUF4403 family protein [Bacteroidales bacterium]
MQTNRISFGLLALVMLSSCSTIRPDRPVPTAGSGEFSLQPSLLYIPLDMDIGELEKLLNSQLTGLIYEDNSLDDNGGDNLMVKAWKQDDIKISLKGNVLTYRVPLKLWIKAGWKIERFGLSLSDYREMNAAIALTFSTAITLNPDWSFTTSTSSGGYEWLSAPVVKVGPVQVPITKIADLILAANKKKISREIDKAVADNLMVKQMAEKFWNAVHEPVMVNEAYQVWLRIQPEGIFSTQLSGSAGKLHHAMGISALVEAFIGQKPPAANSRPLPKLSLGEIPREDFLINLSIDLPYTWINELAGQHLAGQVFTHEKYTIQLKEADVYPGGDKLIVHAKVAGSLKGDLYFSGKPVYDSTENSIRIRELDFDIRTRNALVKAGNWLFHSKILGMIEKNLVFPLDSHLALAQSMMQQQVREIPLSGNIFLTGTLSGIRLGEITPGLNSVRATVILTGKMSVKTL